MAEELLKIAKTILLNILIKDIPFALALKNTFKKVSLEREECANITALIGCELRHHLLFVSLIKEHLGDIPLENSIGVLFLLSDTLFLKRFGEENTYSFAKNELLERDCSFDVRILDDLINYVKSTNELIPNRYDKESIEYLSYRFNTPIWIVRMWSKQFGKNICFKMLKANYKPADTTVRVNTLVTTSDQIIAESHNYEKTTVDDILKYVSKMPIKKDGNFVNNNVFYEKESTKVIIDSLDIDPIKKIAIYSAYPNNVYLDLAVRFGKDIEIDIVNNHTQSYFETKKGIETFGLKRINIFDETHKEIVTSISSPVDVFFVLPRNSSLDLLRTTPDYFLKIRQDDLDCLLSEQKETLENSADRVERGGKIIYMIPTLSMKEGHQLIRGFIESHPNYSLVEERQFFPYESLDSCLYYAIIKKED